MKNFLNKNPGTRRKLFGLIVASGILFAIVVCLRQPGAVAALSATSETSSGFSSRFGPGLWTEPGPGASAAAESAALDTVAPGGLATTAEQHLTVNKALHDVIDYFLLGGHPGERAQHVANLLAHLKQNLPGAAYAESVHIVQNYLAYLDAHDRLLERESAPAITADSKVSPLDVDRIASWVARRARLRQDLLGIKVAQIWFGEEETGTQQDLTKLRQRGEGGSPAITAESDVLQKAGDTLLMMRAKGISQQAQREHIASQFGPQAAGRFDAMEHEEQAWQARYANYRRAVEQILRQTGTDPTQRNRQIEVLQTQTFLTEPELLRARALDRR